MALSKRLWEETELPIRKERLSKCVYPDWEGGYDIGEHNFDNEGFCIICGKTIEQSKVFK